MEQEIYRYRDYKRYLDDTIQTRFPGGRGGRSRMAGALGCHTAYVSQVLNGNAHLSLEQADLTNRFLEHDRDEGKFFLLLVQLARAGTVSLKKVFDDEIAHSLALRDELKNRLKFNRTLTLEQQATYYGAWYHAAIHVLTSIPGFDTKEAIGKALRLPADRVSDALSFLVECGLVEIKDGKYRAGSAVLHLGNDSPLIAKHHVNWRLQSVQALDRRRAEDLHYSSVAALSRSDAKKIREMLVKAIEEVRAVVRPSKEEGLYCYLVDLFEMA